MSFLLFLNVVICDVNVVISDIVEKGALTDIFSDKHKHSTFPRI